MNLPLVFLDGPWRLTMGLGALDLRDWLWLDGRCDAELAQRRGLLAGRLDEVHGMLPGSEAAAAETRDLVVGWLSANAPETLDPAVDLEDPLPLRAAGALVQEDLCVMERSAEGGYALTAACLCFPAHWSLRAKLGLPMRAIHAPVPGFEARLAGAADRFFDTLTVERPVWRANWSIVGDPDLFQPGDSKPAVGVGAHNAGLRLHLRVERQTLRRLPATRAVLFTIRTFVRPIHEIATPAVAAPLAMRLREMDADMARFKGLTLLREPLIAWLERRAAVGAQEHAA